MKYKFGSNYVSSEIAMSTKEEERNIEVSGIIGNAVDVFGNAIQEYNQNYKRIWPLHIHPCKKIYFFGTKMYDVTYFHVRGLWMLWVVSYLLLYVEPLWNIISKS